METSPALEARFSLTYGERLRAAWALTRKPSSSLVWLSIFPLFGIFLLASLILSGDISVLSIVVVLGCFGFSPFMLLFNTYSAHRAERHRGLFSYRFDESGLQVTSATSELKQSWAAISRVYTGSGILFLYFSKQYAHSVPLRALGGPDPAAAVMSLASAGGVPRVGT